MNILSTRSECSNSHRIFSFAVFGIVSMLGLLPPLRADYLADQAAQNQARAEYWSQRGYRFDPQIMTGYLMDQKVNDIQRAAFWKQKGYNFDPYVLTAYLMDQKVQDIERARYWKARGYSFDPDIMTAYLMNQKVLDIQRAKYWKTRGYDFDPNIMTAYLMDQAVASGSSHSSGSSIPQTTFISQVYPIASATTAPRAMPVGTLPNGTNDNYQAEMLTPIAKAAAPDAVHASVVVPPQSSTTP